MQFRMLRQQLTPSRWRLCVAVILTRTWTIATRIKTRTRLTRTRTRSPPTTSDKDLQHNLYTQMDLSLSLPLHRSMSHLHYKSTAADAENPHDNLFHVGLLLRSCVSAFSSMYVLPLHCSTLLIHLIPEAPLVSCASHILLPARTTIARMHSPSPCDRNTGVSA